jgi:branched-chain amino acid aminotransferase
MEQKNVNLPKYAYFQGQIVPYSEAKVGVLTHALNYGTAAFGGIRAYWNDSEQQLFIFRPQDHYRRLLNSARLLHMSFSHTPESLVLITIELLRMEAYRRDIYVRPLVYKADEIIGVKLHGLRDELTIAAVPFDKYVADDTNVHATISNWRRVDDNVIPARGKISGAYANSALAKTDAQLAGYDESLVLTQEGHLSEGSAMNVFLVRDGVLCTPPTTDNVLEGITRRTVMELARQEMGIQTVERLIDRTEAYLASEVFFTGTAAQVTAVTRVDHRPVGDGKMGPITAQLRQLYADAVRGMLPQYRAWNVGVY